MCECVQKQHEQHPAECECGGAQRGVEERWKDSLKN